MSATAGKCTVLSLLLLLLVPACKSGKPAAVEPRKPAPMVIIKTKNPVLSPEQRKELGFPEDLIAKLELSAGAAAEPFFVTVVVPSQNLKGEEGFEKEKLAGFSFHTRTADELISSYRSGLRVKGYLIFKSHKGFGSLPDIVTVVRGNNSYDILKIQGTEASNYNLDTKAIIGWLKQQQFGSFFISGAGPDWVEARFIKQPGNMEEFARKVFAFAPDVRSNGPQTADKLAEEMRNMNGFYLVWD